jgi:PAS domain S-box-containing protein
MSQQTSATTVSKPNRTAPERIETADEGRLRDLLSALDLSNACVRDLDGTICFWCRGNEQLYGWNRSEAVGRITHELLQTRFPIPLPEIEEELLGRGSWKGELRHTSKFGKEVLVASHWVLRTDRDGNPRSVIEVNNDITAWREGREAAQYLAAIVESSEDAILAKNLAGIITSWNSGAERMFGYSAEEMIGSSITKLIPPEFASEERTIQERLRRRERIPNYETVRITKSGKRITISNSISPICGEDGEIIGGSAIARDVSRSKELEAAVFESESRQRLAMEAGELGLWSYDVASRRSHWSPQCKLILGYAPDAPMPKLREVLQLVHPNDASRVQHTFYAGLRKGSPFDMEFRIQDQTGNTRWLQMKGRPLTNQADGVIQVHGTVLDFTNRKRTEEALRRSNGQLQQFAYAAAHDLQEPLRNIALALQLAQYQSQGQLDDNSRELLSSAAQNAQRMKDMVRALLAYAGALHEDETEWPKTSCAEVLADVMATLAFTIRESFAQITSDELPDVKMDRTHLAQVFQNLIGNALKYRGAEPPRIHIGVKKAPRSCELSVSDNGIGIEAEYQERVFGVFKRLRKTDASGTGLGLALCKRIVEHYGGEIRVESDGRRGSTFFFTAPLA